MFKKKYPPGNMVPAGFRGFRELKAGFVEEGSRGTVGKPGEEHHT